MAVLTRLALRRPKLIAALVVVATLLAALGMTRTWTDVGYRVFLGERHEAIVALERLIDRYGGGLPILIAWECGPELPCSHALDEPSLRMSEMIESELLDHPLVRQVVAPSSANVLLPTEDGLEVRRLLESGSIPQDAPLLIEQARADPMWVGSIVSEDGSVGAILLQLTSTESRVTAEVVDFVQSILYPLEAQGHRFYLVGDPVDFVVSGGQMQDDTPRMMAALVAALVLTAWLLLRSWRAVLLSLSTAGLALVWAMGAMSWLGWPEMELTQALRPGILVVALCDAIHLVARYGSLSVVTQPATIVERRRLVQLAAEAVVLPCLLTTLTTAVAFLSFTTSGSQAFARFGVIAALGVCAALVLTFAALPIALLALDPRRVQSAVAQEGWARLLERLVTFSARHRRAVLSSAAVVVIVSASGIVGLRVDLDERELLGHDSRVVQWASFVEDNLRKSDTLELTLSSPDGSSILEPDSLAFASSVRRGISSLDGVGPGRSIVDLLSTINRAMHGGDPAYLRPSNSLNGNSQLLLLLETSGGGTVDSWLHSDREMRISFEADPLSTEERSALIGQIRSQIESVLPPGWIYGLTGPFTVYLAFADVVQQTQLWSFASAFTAIVLILFVHLRLTTGRISSAAWWTTVAMAPSCLPVVITLGAMGFLGIPLDVGTAMVGAIIIGIAVDDSIHLITAFHTARAEGLARSRAIRSAVVKTGQALVTSSTALSVGFFALTLSSWQSIASFGLLSGLAIIVALLSDLLVLPALVLVFDRTTGSDRPFDGRITSIPGRAARWCTSFVCITVVVVAAWPLSRGTSVDSGMVGPCRIEASGRVIPLSTLSEECPLKVGDTVHSIAVDDVTILPRQIGSDGLYARSASIASYSVERPGHRSRVVVTGGDGSGSVRSARPLELAPILVIALWLALTTIWLSSAQASLAFAVLTVGIASATTTVASSLATEATMASMYLALGALAASGLQMSLTFPRRTRLVEDVPGLRRLFAVVGATVSVAAYWGNVRYGAMWAVAVSLSVGFVLMAMLRILWEAAASRSDADQLDKRRARVAATGAATVVLVGVADVTNVVAPPDWVGAVALVIGLCPIGYALIRHQYYSTEDWLRSGVGVAIGAVLFLPVAVLLLDANHLLGANEVPPGTVRSFSLAALAFTTALGSASLGRLVARAWVPDRFGVLAAREEAVSDDLEAARGEDEVCRKLARALTDGLRSSFVSIALVRQGKLEIVAASGERPVGPSGLRRVLVALDGSSGLLHIGPEGGVSDWRWVLLAREGVAVAMRIQWNSETLGAVFIGGAVDEAAYSHEELSYVNRLCRCAGSALHHERLRVELTAMERSATLHSVGAGLMHSVGKPLSIAARSADRLIARGQSDQEVIGLACIVRMAADEALSGIRTLREQADQPLAPGAPRIPVDEIIARSTSDAAQLHGGRRVICRLGADLPAMPHGDEIRRLVTNLLDNALLATDPGQSSPEVRVRRQQPWLVIEVVDFGTGMDAATLARATEAFFTTRRGAGGSGIGLMDVKTTAERLHGDLRLCSTPRRGTRATVRVPLPDGARPHERLWAGASAPGDPVSLQ